MVIPLFRFNPWRRPSRGALFLMVSLCWITPLHSIMSMNIPNYCANPTITSVANGNWSNPATWSPARVPNASDRVEVSIGTTVIFDATAGDVDALCIEGTLRFRTNVDTQLKVANLHVEDVGTLEVGTQATPVAANVKAEIIIKDRVIDTTFDPEQWGTSLIVMGKISMVGATLNPTFVRTAVAPKAGDSTITLAQAPSGWKVGDRIFVPDSNVPCGSSCNPKTVVMQWEEMVIASLSGTSLGLASPLLYNHPGAVDGDGNPEPGWLPHIGNLTRNVIIRSENPAGTRGHVLATGHADVDIEYTLFKDLARTVVTTPLDSTVMNGMVATHIGTNQIGRYPLHMHHLVGPASPQPNGRQFTLVGNAIDGGSAKHDFKWGITIHNSHYGLVKDNVLYNVSGGGIVAEDGSETENIIQHNFVARVNGSAEGRGLERSNVGDFSFENNAFWFRGVNNRILDNVAADSFNGAGAVLEGGYGYKYFMWYAGNVKIPNFQGADNTIAGQFTTKSANNMPILEFRNNEYYGRGSGVTVWWLCSVDVTPVNGCAQSTMKDMKVWNHYINGFFGYPLSNLVLDNWQGRMNKNRANLNEDINGISNGDYSAHNMTVTNSNIQGYRAGIRPGSFLIGTYTIQNTYLKNALNIHLQSIGAPGAHPDGRSMPPRKVVIDNVRFAKLPGITNSLVYQKNIRLEYSNLNGSAGLSKLDETYVYNYNGVPGDDFRVYYLQQHPSYIMEQTHNYPVGSSMWVAGCPDAGLTNQQCYSLYGVATAGAVLPSSGLVMRPDILGYLDGLNGPLPYPNPTVTLYYLGQGRDVLAPKSFVPDGINEGTFKVEVSYNGQSKTISRLNIQYINAGWNYATASGGMGYLGVAQSLTGPLINNTTNGNVSFNVTNGDSFWLFSAGPPPSIHENDYIELTATFSDGTTSSFYYTIPVLSNIAASSPLPSVTLLATPASITAGGSSTLSWSSTKATTLSINQGIGTVATSGTFTVSPSVTTLYTVTATNASGTVTASASVSLSGSISVLVSPGTVTLGPSQTQTFGATVNGTSNTSVTWTLSPAVGTVSATGLYTSPATITSAQSVTIKATSVADPTKSGSATISLNPPAAPTLSLSKTTLSFSATAGGASPASQSLTIANGATNGSVLNWTGTSNQSWLTLSPASGGNTLTPVSVFVNTSGLAVGSYTGSLTFTDAKASNNPQQIPISLNINPPITVSLSPTNATLGPSQSQTFTATIGGTSNTSLTWTRSPAVGTLTSGGIFTAPATITTPQTITVTATSVADPSKAASASVILAPPVQVSINPSSTQLGPSGSQAFNATVTGTANTAVTWTISPTTVGSINSAGLYFAPATVSSQQTVTVKATSVADPTKFGTGTVLLTPLINQPPVVSLTDPMNGALFTAPANILLSATATDADGIITQVAFYQGNSLLFRDSQSPFSFSWINVPAGHYQVTAVATDDSGATTTSGVATIAVNPPTAQPPTAVIQATPLIGAPPLAVQADASGSFDSWGTIINYRWDFGDGTIGSGVQANHVYTTPGLYAMTLLVTNDVGLSGAAATVVYVTGSFTGGPGSLPMPYLNLPAFAPVNGSLSVAYPPGYNNIQFFWTITPVGGSAPVPSAGAGVSNRSASATFSTVGRSANLQNQGLTPGVYTVSVYASDGTGQSASVSQTITLVASDFSTVKVYPNPWRTDHHSTQQITFDGLPLNSTIKLFTVSGKWIKNLTPSATTAIWDLTTDSGDKAASGIYLYLIQTEGASGQKRGKLVIIR